MKNKVKRIGTFICALVVVVWTFATVPYYASDSGVNATLSSLSLPIIEDLKEDCDYILFSLDNKMYVVGARSSEGVIGGFRYEESVSSSGYFGLISMYNYRANGSSKYMNGTLEYSIVYALEGEKWTVRRCSSAFWDDGGLGSLSSSSMNTLEIYYSSVDVCYWDCSFNGVFYSADNVGSYSSDLGYLNNARIENTFLTTDHGKEIDYSSFRKTLKFDKLSTTGIDLSSGDYVIRVYGQMCYQKTVSDEIYDDNFPLVYFGDFEIVSNSISYNSQDLFDLVSGSTEDPYSVWDIWTKTIHRSDITYYQIYNKNTHEYGGYLKVVLGGAEGSMYSQTTLKDDMSVDSEGFEDKNLIGSAGSGTTYEDAEINADKNYNDLMNNGGIQGLEGAINAFTSTLGVVPQAIGSVFSFLPSWCLDLWGVAFGLIAVLIVYKILRG